MSYRIGYASMLCLLMLGCNRPQEDVRSIVREELGKATERKFISPTETIGPYTPAVRIGNFLFLSGQIGLDQSTGQLRNEDIETETRQVLDNVNTILRAAGYDSSHVVSATVYLKNMDDYGKMNRVYGGYFAEGSYPARTTVAVADLPKQANVEIAVVACK